MSLKEKANQLIIKFSDCGENREMYVETAKKCALLCVEEQQQKLYGIINPKADKEYWKLEEMKQHIVDFN